MTDTDTTGSDLLAELGMSVDDVDTDDTGEAPTTANVDPSAADGKENAPVDTPPEEPPNEEAPVEPTSLLEDVRAEKAKLEQAIQGRSESKVVSELQAKIDEYEKQQLKLKEDPLAALLSSGYTKQQIAAKILGEDPPKPDPQEVASTRLGALEAKAKQWEEHQQKEQIAKQEKLIMEGITSVIKGDETLKAALDVKGFTEKVADQKAMYWQQTGGANGGKDLDTKIAAKVVLAELGEMFEALKPLFGGSGTAPEKEKAPPADHKTLHDGGVDGTVVASEDMTEEEMYDLALKTVLDA